MVAASGEQYVLTHVSSVGVYRAVIAQVGASLRVFTIDDIELVEPYGEDQRRPLCAGAIMTPWVNRLDGGTWVHNGATLHNEINIVDQRNANHGLLLDHAYDVERQSESAVTLHATITPSPGYPFLVDTWVTYDLSESGLTVTHRALNRSTESAPFATGAHPYFKFSSVETSELTLFSDAATHTVVDDRQIPISTRPTVGTEFDFRDGIRVGSRRVDEDFTDLPLAPDGHSHVYLKADDGRGLDVWQDATFKHVVVFTPDNFPAADGTAVYVAAIEPSTAAPNAFNNGVDLTWLEPGDEFEARWGVSVTL